jgi:putative SOS response-associated peptidase YedK
MRLSPTVANELVADIHDKKRMPVILRPEDYERWLCDTNEVTDLMKPYPKKRDEGPDLFSSIG